MQEVCKVTPLEIWCVRGNALEIKLCKIPTIGTQSENQTLPQHQPSKPNRL